MGRRRSGARADRERRREAEGETGGERGIFQRSGMLCLVCGWMWSVNGMWRSDVCGGWLDAGLGEDAVCCVWRCVVPWLFCVACCVWT